MPATLGDLTACKPAYQRVNFSSKIVGTPLPAIPGETCPGGGLVGDALGPGVGLVGDALGRERDQARNVPRLTRYPPFAASELAGEAKAVTPQ